MLKLLRYPDRRLSQPSTPVLVFDDHIALLVRRMFDVLYEYGGIGLAAPQVGVNKRVIITNVGEPLALINPKVTSREGKQVLEEMCLSVPGAVGRIERSNRISVAAQDVNGAQLALGTDGLLAACIQHEIDHLDGRLFTTRTKNLSIRRVNPFMGGR